MDYHPGPLCPRLIIYHTMAPQAPWSPAAHAFAQHQFSHVVNFWKHGRQANFRLEVIPEGQAELNLTFMLPSASQVIPPPSYVPPVSAPQRPIPPLFPRGCFSRQFGAHSSQKKTSPRQRKSYRRSVQHREWFPTPSCTSLCSAPASCFSFAGEYSKWQQTTPP